MNGPFEGSQIIGHLGLYIARSSNPLKAAHSGLLSMCSSNYVASVDALFPVHCRDTVDTANPCRDPPKPEHVDVFTSSFPSRCRSTRLHTPLEHEQRCCYCEK